MVEALKTSSSHPDRSVKEFISLSISSSRAVKGDGNQPCRSEPTNTLFDDVLTSKGTPLNPGTIKGPSPVLLNSTSSLIMQIALLKAAERGDF
jgi:hypothetical protein